MKTSLISSVHINGLAYPVIVLDDNNIIVEKNNIAKLIFPRLRLFSKLSRHLAPKQLQDIENLRRDKYPCLLTLDNYGLAGQYSQALAVCDDNSRVSLHFMDYLFFASPAANPGLSGLVIGLLEQLNVVLSAVSPAARMLEDGSLGSDERLKYLQFVTEHCQRLNRINASLAQLLKTAVITKNEKPAPFNATKILREIGGAIHRFSPAMGYNVRITVPDEPFIVNSNPQTFCSQFLSMIHMALKNSDNGKAALEAIIADNTLKCGISFAPHRFWLLSSDSAQRNMLDSFDFEVARLDAQHHGNTLYIERTATTAIITYELRRADEIQSLNAIDTAIDFEGLIELYLTDMA